MHIVLFLQKPDRISNKITLIAVNNICTAVNEFTYTHEHSPYFVLGSYEQVYYNCNHNTQLINLMKGMESMRKVNHINYV